MSCAGLGGPALRFCQEETMHYLNNPQLLSSLMNQLTKGFGTSLSIFAWTLILSLPLGMIVALGRMSRHKWISAPVSLS